MPISGLVVFLSEDSETRVHALEAIAADARIEVGEFVAGKMSLAVETNSSAEDREIWDWLNNLPGVAFVQVAFIAFEGGDAPAAETGLDPIACKARAGRPLPSDCGAVSWMRTDDCS